MIVVKAIRFASLRGRSRPFRLTFVSDCNWPIPACHGGLIGQKLSLRHVYKISGYSVLNQIGH